MRQTQRLQDIHAEALAEFDAIQSAVQQERLQCLDDRRFYSIAGAQWEGPLGEQFDKRPRLEFNKVHLAVIRIISEYRNNRITVDFTPKDGASNQELAETCDGLYRADEQDSSAQEAYDNAYEEAVGGGMGAWRLRACYEDDEDDENDKQRIRMEPIFDADSCVFFDLDAKRQDKADAKRCFVLTPMSHDAFKAEFGHDPASWQKAIQRWEFDWVTPQQVWVAEYYRVEEQSEVVVIFRGIAGDERREKLKEIEEDEDKRRVLEAMGYREVNTKRVKTRRVRKYIMSGQQIEEDEGYIAGKCIPIIPVYGKRWVVDGIERCMGHVRLAKDAQRLMNSILSWLTEIAARFDVEKPIFAPEQIAGHAEMWARDNIDRYPYLLANAMKDADGQPIPGSQAPTAYTRAPNIPPAMAALVQIAGQALEDLLGNQQAGEEIVPNVSGKAVELIQQRLDMQTFIYMSNFAKGMKRCGEVWLSMAKDLFVEDKRPMKTMSSDGQMGTVVLREPQIGENGETYMANDIGNATFDVWVDVGPSSGTKRQATVRGLTGMASLSQDPATRDVLMSAAMMNMEGEGLQDVQDWFRQKLVRMGVVKPSEEEAEAMAAEQANQQPDPQSQYLLKAAEAEEAKAAKARADTVNVITQAEKNRAETQKIVTETEGARQGQVLDVAEALRQASTPPSL